MVDPGTTKHTAAATAENWVLSQLIPKSIDCLLGNSRNFSLDNDYFPVV